MYKAVSLFSGCGGLDLGFHRAGFDLVGAFDNDPFAIDVYRRNIDQRAAVCDVASPDFHSEIARIGHVDVVLGGFPCQGFSKAGPKQIGDARNLLYLQMKSVIGTLKPRVFLAENVDGLSQNYGGSYVKSIVEDFSAQGYDVDFRVLDAAAFGVPQHRRRIFFIGTMKGSGAPKWPTPKYNARQRNGEFKIRHTGFWDEPLTHNEVALQPRTLRDAIHDLPALGELPDHDIARTWPAKYADVFRAIGPGQKLCNVRHGPTSVYTWQIPSVFGSVSTFEKEILEVIARNRRHKSYGNVPNGNPIPLGEIARLLNLKELPGAEISALLSKGYLKAVGDGFDLKGAMFCSGLFKRPRWDEPSPTILTNFHSPRYFLHPSEDRPFTLRECARIQGFPDDFSICDANQPASLIDGYRVVGNAVPPPLSHLFALAIGRFLDEQSGVRHAA